MSVTSSQTLLSPRLTAMQTVAENAVPKNAGGVSSLTSRIAAGDEAAFNEFHALYFDRLYRLLIVIARGDEDQAKESLQMTLLRVVRYARIFDSEEAFWCWLKVVARSAARDAGRKQQRYSALLQKIAGLWRPEPTSAPANAQGEEDQLRLALQESLAELSTEDRQLLECKYLEGDPARVLAERWNVSQKALESRILRLRHDLRQRILKRLGGK